MYPPPKIPPFDPTQQLHRVPTEGGLSSLFSVIGLETLVQTYVSAINSGDLPCMENAVLALAETEVVLIHFTAFSPPPFPFSEFTH